MADLHDAWPQSLVSENAVDALAQQLALSRSAFHGDPLYLEWLDVPMIQRVIYHEMALRLIMRLGPPVKSAVDDRLRRVADGLARNLEVVK